MLVSYGLVIFAGGGELNKFELPAPLLHPKDSFGKEKLNNFRRVHGGFLQEIKSLKTSA
jgi:hypothetical protein